MHLNPLLKKLGLPKDARAVILHADDIGMCQASLAAYADLLDFGLISSAATMVPCPWFPATAALCRERGDAVDMGVHLTLTAEWSGYRWRPLSTCDPATGLIDGAGYFHTSRPPVAKADPVAVAAELRAQVERAVADGIDITHIDSHMGTVFNPAFLESYVSLALEYGVPPMLPRLDEPGIRAMGFSSEVAAFFAVKIQEMEAAGLPLLDTLLTAPLEAPEERLEQTQQTLRQLPVGISYFILHPSKDTPELRAITPDWRARVGDYQVFTSEALRRFIADEGIHIIGYRAVRDATRSSAQAASHA